MTIEKLEPVGLTGSSAGTGVLEGASDLQLREHAALHVKEDLVEVDAAGILRAGHKKWGTGTSVHALRLGHWCQSPG
jgi:hypothetical protein